MRDDPRLAVCNVRRSFFWWQATDLAVYLQKFVLSLLILSPPQAATFGVGDELAAPALGILPPWP